MKAMLFAAGLGTRLKPFTESAPKALAPIGKSTLLAHNILMLQRFGIRELVINVHHYPEMIVDYLKQHNHFGSQVTISNERDELLETGGGLLKAMPFFSGEQAFLVMNVDVLTNINITQLIHAHLEGSAMATLAVMRRASSRDLLFDSKMDLCGWRNNNTKEERIALPHQNLFPFAFSGIQVLSPAIWAGIALSGKFSLIDLYLLAAKDRRIFGYDHSGDLFLDVGKPDSVEQSKKLFPELWQ
jgi:N-acetyl-alpha-D-muramate 1-phosphate uridylyltransferase